MKTTHAATLLKLIDSVSFIIINDTFITKLNIYVFIRIIGATLF